MQAQNILELGKRNPDVGKIESLQYYALEHDYSLFMIDEFKRWIKSHPEVENRLGANLHLCCPDYILVTGVLGEATAAIIHSLLVPRDKNVDGSYWVWTTYTRAADLFNTLVIGMANAPRAKSQRRQLLARLLEAYEDTATTCQIKNQCLPFLKMMYCLAGRRLSVDYINNLWGPPSLLEERYAADIFLEPRFVQECSHTGKDYIRMKVRARLPFHLRNRRIHNKVLNAILIAVSDDPAAIRAAWS